MAKWMFRSRTYRSNEFACGTYNGVGPSGDPGPGGGSGGAETSGGNPWIRTRSLAYRKHRRKHGRRT